MLSWRKVMVTYLVAMALLGGLLGLLGDTAGGSLNPFRDAGLPVNRGVQEEAVRDGSCPWQLEAVNLVGGGGPGGVSVSFGSPALTGPRG